MLQALVNQGLMTQEQADAKQTDVGREADIQSNIATTTRVLKELNAGDLVPGNMTRKEAALFGSDILPKLAQGVTEAYMLGGA